MDKYRNNNIIRHDLRERRLSFTAAIVCSVIAIGNIMILYSDLTDKINAELVAVFIILGAVIFSAAAFVLWLFWFDCFCYLGRLKKHGYVLPKNKKNVADGLAGLRNNVGDTENKRTANKRCAGSIFLGTICFAISIAVIISIIRFYLQYNSFIDTNPMLLSVTIHIIMLLIWLGLGIYFSIQSDNSRYKDDVELDPDRKIRKNITEGIFLIIILAIITFLAVRALYSMADYISYETRLIAEQNY